VHNDFGQAGDAPQAARLIEIGDDWPRALVAPEGTLAGITQQCKDMVVAKQMGQQAAGDVTATDDQ